MDRVLCLTAMFFICTNQVHAQRFVLAGDELDEREFVVHIDFANEFENAKFAVASWGYPAELLSVHTVESVEVLGGNRVRKCAGNSHRSKQIALPFRSGVRYSIKVLSDDLCKECVKDFSGSNLRLFGSADTKERIDAGRGLYQIGIFANGDDRAFIFSDPSRSVNYSTEMDNSFDEMNLSSHVASWNPKKDTEIFITCIDMPRSTSDSNDAHRQWRDIHDPFKAPYKLSLYHRIADGAYHMDVGDSVAGVVHTWDGLTAGNSPSPDTWETLFIGGDDSPLESRYPVLNREEYKVVEVIEGEPISSLPPKNHVSLGEIPNGFRAIILQHVNNSYTQIIGYAGTNFEERSDVWDDIVQGIPMFDWPWSGPISRPFDIRIPYGTVAYEPPDADRISAQYAFALKVAKYTLSGRESKPLLIPLPVENTRRGSLVVCGHSLGGGLANYASGMLGVRGYGFNSAALASGAQRIRRFGVPWPDLYFTHVRTTMDPVSMITPTLPAGELIGDHFIVGSTAKYRFITDHSIMNMDVEKLLKYIPPRSLMEN